MEFYRQATPIDAIESGSIGSRPARRTGAKTLSDLRAIPWVFSWSQCRYNMTSWYGLGSTLEKLKAERLADYEAIRSAAVDDPFVSYLMHIVATGISFSDEAIMEDYASLVESAEVRSVFLEKFKAERSKTLTHLTEILGKGEAGSLLVMDERRRALLAPLHRKPMELLRTWRQNKQKGEEEGQGELLLSLLLTINAISGVMGYTG